MPTRGVPIDWCAPPSGRERDARGGAGDQEAGVLVAGVVQGIEAAVDERVIDRADGDQALAEERVGKAGGAEEEEEVHLGDAKFDVLAVVG